jgi:hypothetical protein
MKHSPLELQVVPSDEELAAGTREIRRWHRRYWFLFLTFLPVGGGLMILLGVIFGGSIIAAAPPLFWLLAVLVTSARANSLRCPRCGNPFRPVWGLQVPRDPHCMACDLPLTLPSA